MPIDIYWHYKIYLRRKDDLMKDYLLGIIGMGFIESGIFIGVICDWHNPPINNPLKITSGIMVIVGLVIVWFWGKSEVKK